MLVVLLFHFCVGSSLAKASCSQTAFWGWKKVNIKVKFLFIIEPTLLMLFAIKRCILNRIAWIGYMPFFPMPQKKGKKHGLAMQDCICSLVFSKALLEHSSLNRSIKI